MMEQTAKRADSLDALRGLAILLMILSGNIHFANPLPAWMYHAQVPPSDFVFNPNLPGITWVDLVFPFFLFAMGVAFPFALSKKLDGGVPKWKIMVQILWRGILLTGFAIYLQHIKPFAFSAQPTAFDWLLGILGFALLFPILLRLPQTLKPAVRYSIKAAGIAGAIGLLSYITFPDGSGFSVNRSDIIIIVLANVAVFGSLIWLFTQGNILVRLGILGILIAIRLTQSIDGSWNHWLWTATPFPWMYKLYYLQYLFIVLPGTIVGDLIYKWMKSPSVNTTEEGGTSSSRMILSFGLMVSFLLVNLVGLYSRMLLATALANAALCVTGYVLFSKARATIETLHRSLFQWGSYWLVLGLFFEAFEGGIKKDHPTLSYYFVTTGLAVFTYIAFSILIDHFKKRKYVAILVDNGQNPMIAYIAGSTLVFPILALTRLESLLESLSSTPWLGFCRGVLFTALVALVTSFFTKRKLFWRT
jgi:predicted acyltransferase